MLVQERVAMLLHKLGSDDGLQSIQDLYKVHKSTKSKITMEFLESLGNISNEILCKPK